MLLNILVFCILFKIGLVRAQIGDQCTHKKTGLPGRCKLVIECQVVLADALAGKEYSRCGFQGRLEIVCCPIAFDNKDSVGPRISEKKCTEYSQAVNVTRSVNGKRRIINRCGNKDRPLVVGGEDAKPREFPHMALLGYGEGEGTISWMCGGSLISDQFVMTAAHCTTTKAFGNVARVRLGELDLSTTNEATKTEDFAVAEIISHPKYSDTSHYNDIALLKLDRKVKFDAYKRPACLPLQFSIKEINATATGWGHTDFSHPSADVLQKVTLQIFSNEECNRTYSADRDENLQEGIKGNQQICAGHKLAIKDTCQGDSGGPLQIFHSTEYCMYTIIGVTSFGVHCGTVGSAGVYTRVYGYLDWIEKIVWQGV